jgi:hypothetical protein
MNARLTRFALIGMFLLTGALQARSQVPIAVLVQQIAVAADSYELLPIVEDELLVLEVRLENSSSGHGLIAYPYQDSALLPLGEICSILELAVQTDPHTGTAFGWIIDEDRVFALDIPNKTMTLNGNLWPLPERVLSLDENDIYIRSDILSDWLPIDLDINLPRMHVKITPREILPFQSRLKRDEQRSVWLASKGKNVMTYPQHVAPYRMWSWPMVDATMSLLSNRYGDTQRLSMQSNSDLGGLSSNFMLSHMQNDQRSFTSTRMKAGRWDPQGELLGKAQATRYEFGDLFISRVPLISSRVQGTGMTISNQALHRSREFDTTDIQGDAPAGWEAELYINGSLYDFQTVGQEGHYVFDNVPLVIGNNVFRTVLYGPRGESREVVEHANISHQMADVGELKYTATLVREGSSVLNSNSSSYAGMEKPWNQQLELGYALSNRNALVGNISRLNIGGRQEMFSSLASHNSLGMLYMESVLAKSLTGGHAFSLGMQTRLRGQNIFLKRNINNDYRAEALNSQQYISDQTSFRTSGSIFDSVQRNVFYSFTANNRDYRDSDLRNEKDYQFHTSTSFRKLILSHRLSYRDREYASIRDQEWLGTQLVRSWLGPLSVRGDLNYQLAPVKMRSATATINFNRMHTLQTTVRMSHYFDTSYGLDNASLEFTRLFDNFTLGCNLSIYESLGPSFGITIGTFLARDVRANQWASTHRPMSSRAIASVCTFIDRNGNRKFDEGDEPLEGVGFMNLTPWKKIRTNSEGYAFLPGLLVHRTQVIELNLPTVVDPFLIPLEKGATVIGHPGSIIDVEFPFTYAGEIEGMIVDAANPNLPVRHVGLELVDTEGERVGSAVSEFDGYYYFTEVLPGDYEIRVIPMTINTRIYKQPEPYAINVPYSGGYITGPDIHFQRHKTEIKPVLPMPAGVGPVVSNDTGDTVSDASPLVGPVVDEPTPAPAKQKSVLNNLIIRDAKKRDKKTSGRRASDYDCTRKK